MENETGVSKQTTAAEPAKTAENLSAGGAPGASAASSSEAAEETPVSRQVIMLTPEVSDAIRTLVQAELATEINNFLLAHPPTIGVHQMEELIEGAGQTANTTVQQAMTAYDLEVTRKIEAAKADILAHLTPLISAIVEGRPAPPVATRETARAAVRPPVKILNPADPVKVWSDPEHKTFRLGQVVAEHDGGHAYDVELDDGTVTKIGADGLEYDG